MTNETIFYDQRTQLKELHDNLDDDLDSIRVCKWLTLLDAVAANLRSDDTKAALIAACSILYEFAIELASAKLRVKQRSTETKVAPVGSDVLPTTNPEPEDTNDEGKWMRWAVSACKMSLLFISTAEDAKAVIQTFESDANIAQSEADALWQFWLEHTDSDDIWTPLG